MNKNQIKHLRNIKGVKYENKVKLVSHMLIFAETKGSRY